MYQAEAVSSTGKTGKVHRRKTAGLNAVVLVVAFFLVFTFIQAGLNQSLRVQELNRELASLKEHYGNLVDEKDKLNLKIASCRIPGKVEAAAGETLKMTAPEEKIYICSAGIYSSDENEVELQYDRDNSQALVGASFGNNAFYKWLLGKEW